MLRMVSTLICAGLRLTASGAATEEQIVQDLTANGSRTTRPFTVNDGWEVRWPDTNDLLCAKVSSIHNSIDSLKRQQSHGTHSGMLGFFVSHNTQVSSSDNQRHSTAPKPVLPRNTYIRLMVSTV
jgi:hypothetical protein